MASRTTHGTASARLGRQKTSAVLNAAHNSSERGPSCRTTTPAGAVTDPGGHDVEHDVLTEAGEQSLDEVESSLYLEPATDEEDFEGPGPRRPRPEQGQVHPRMVGDHARRWSDAANVVGNRERPRLD